MFVSGFSPCIGYAAFLHEGFDPQTKTVTISEAKLQGMHKETFWDSLESQGTEKLVITCKDGKTVTYEKGFFNRLLDAKPDLADLSERFTLEFSGGAPLEETKSKLLMCGDMFESLLNANTVEHETHRVSLPMIQLQSFQEVMQAIENDVIDISGYSEYVRLAMDFLIFHPVALPRGVYGKKDWNARGADVGHVPPPPKELLEFLKKTCPITKDGIKPIDTHVIAWVSPTLNGEPMTVDNLEKIAQADAFGENKIGYESISETLRHDAVINQPLSKGYWVALYMQPIAPGMLFADQKKYIEDNFTGYQVPKTREVIIASFMQYGCSGDKKEGILSREKNVCCTRCEEKIEGLFEDRHVVVGALAPSGLFVQNGFGERDAVGVCPVRRFF